MKIIVGLGNPGRSYSRHRHNVGFLVVETLCGRHKIEMKRRSFGAIIGSGSIEGEAVVLAMPQTYMNCSGDAVAPLVGYYKLGIEDLVVVHDDLDIGLGNLKLAKGAGHGGHNGVRSIMEALGSGDFFRIRVGIGRPPENVDAASFVLHPFEENEISKAEDLVRRATDCVELLIKEGLAKAQQKYH